jgi:hypothetical protein
MTVKKLAIPALLLVVATHSAEKARPTLWHDPTDIATRDLFYGSGGKAHEPHGGFTFLKEDTGGTNPKFTVKDADGTKWKVKLGNETKPETAATRIVWAAGYSVTEDYFLEEMVVQGMPEHLHRGQKLVSAGGIVHNVRLKRESKDEKKDGEWKWRNNPFKGTREFNGLRVVMALINNWDLKDQNNTILKSDGERVYIVSDLGASFGTGGRSWPQDKSKGNLEAYQHAKFIKHVGEKYVDFRTPARPGFELLVNLKEYIVRVRMESIGHKIPREDARWMGRLLSRLSREQLRDAFRAAGYTSAEADGFSGVLQDRIAKLVDL